MNHTTIVQQLDLNRIFPRGEHRWNMGIRRGDAATFFATTDPSDAVRAERCRWLADQAETYAAMLPEAEPALEETLAFARTLGAVRDIGGSSYDQLLALGRAWEPDFVLMHPGAHGSYYLAGGVVCFPSSWSLSEKLGQPMHEVHADVPGLNEQLAPQIELLFARLRPGEAWLRENANYSRDARLNHHPSQVLEPLDATVTPAEFWIRQEHQLLLKLPRTGSILFGIRVEPVPLARVLENAKAAARLAEVFATMSAAAAEYKGISEVRTQVIAWLREAAQR